MSARVAASCSACHKNVEAKAARVLAGLPVYCSSACAIRTVAAARSRKVTCTCVICGGSFDRSPSQVGNYCSRDCANLAKRRFVESTCEVCGKFFSRPPSEMRKTTGRYCSYACTRVGSRRQRVCERCGQPPDGKYARYCLACRLAGRPRRSEQRACAVCGTLRLIRPSKLKSGRGRFCSKQCQSRARAVPGRAPYQTCAHCHDSFSTAGRAPRVEPRFCSRRCYGLGRRRLLATSPFRDRTYLVSDSLGDSGGQAKHSRLLSRAEEFRSARASSSANPAGHVS